MAPEQIVGRCRMQGISMVIVSRIYSYLHQDKWQGGTLYKNCRHHLQYQKRRLAFPSNSHQERKSIQERPVIISEQGRKGDFKQIERRLGIPVYFARPYSSTDKPHI